MADPKTYINEEPTGATVPMFALSINTTNKTVKEWDGANWNPIRSVGAAHTSIKSGGASIIPSNYAAGPVALSQAGDGYALASGARYLSIGVTVALTGTGVFLAFGTSELDAEANVSGTVGSEVGMMIAGAAAGQVVIVGIPSDATITHFALAENHAAPTGKVSVTQGA